MKGKIVLFLLSLICAFSFVACGQNTQSEISNDGSCMESSETATDEADDAIPEIKPTDGMVSGHKMQVKVEKTVNVSEFGSFVPIELSYGSLCFDRDYYEYQKDDKIYSGKLYSYFFSDENLQYGIKLKDLTWEEIQTGKYEIHWIYGTGIPVFSTTETFMLPVEYFTNGKGYVSLTLWWYAQKSLDGEPEPIDLPGEVKMYYERIENEIQFYKIVYFQ